MTPLTKRITAVLVVEQIEPSLPFWQALGLEVTAKVPHGEALGFVILSAEGVELMLQSRASVAADLPALAEAANHGPACLFIEVRDFQATLQALAGFDRISDLRQTFYGSTEATWREPGGHFVTLAEFRGAKP